ncbi:response regulator [Kolteria novifilia]|uniref:response regulator n=1 Tax=Kolteria novifilia TaxID=2527975 RepID=UPI003AF33C45
MAHPKILIVDDQPDICRTIGKVLTLNDFPVELVNDPHEAIEKMAQGLYRIVFSDIQMPGMSGLELLKALKSRSPMAVVIMMTAFHDQGMVVECIEHGAHDFLTKPIEPLELILEVAQDAEKKVRRWAKALKAVSYPLME